MRRAARRALLGLAVVLLVGTALALVSAMRMRSPLEEGRTELAAAQSALLQEDLDEAQARFSAAAEAFSRALDHPGSWVLRSWGVLPWLGRNPDALIQVAEIGRDLSEAGEALARDTALSGGGIRSLGPSGGRIPVDRIASLSPAVHRLRVALDRANLKAAGLPEAWLFGPVATARDELRSKLARVVPLARSADSMLRSLPSFAGSDGPRRYFVAPQNLAEQRGTGGLIGNFAILTIDDGAMTFGRFSDIGALRDLPASSVPPPSEDFAELYGPFGGAGYWLNINMTPDAATAGTVIEALYERVTGERLDGTIFVDLVAFSAMLDATGPVPVPPLSSTLSSGNVVRFVSEARYRGRNGELETLGPGLVASAVWEAFLAEAAPEDALRALVSSAASGHLILHSGDPSIQEAFELAGVAGRFGWRRGDFFSTVVSNAAGNKVDYFMRRTIDYRVTLGTDGSGRSTATVGFANHAPAGARPSYALGPYDLGDALDPLNLEPGENRSWTSFHCAATCRLAAATQGGRPFGLEAHEENGLPLYAGFIRVRPQRTESVRLRLDLQEAWIGDSGGGTYRLRLHGQPAIHPTVATVAVQVPEGMRIVWTSVPMSVQGEVARWSGAISSQRDFEVRFQKPFPGRVWARIWDFLSKPAVRL